MATAFSMENSDIFSRVLSAARWGTFQRMGAAMAHDVCPATLYARNMAVCAELLSYLHICEVATRNAVADALCLRYGPRWPWHAALLRSFPEARGAACAHSELQLLGRRHRSADQLVPHLRFAFWQQMFTRRFDDSLWHPCLTRVFPNIGTGEIPGLRARLHTDLEHVRTLRNRIAHHEPVLERDLHRDLAAIERIIQARCPSTLCWLQCKYPVDTLLGTSRALRR